MAYTAINDPEQHFNIKLYNGNSQETNHVGIGFQPDFVWIKNRDAADSHCLFDSSRGVTKLISSDANTAETTDGDTLEAFDSDGFQIDIDDKVNTQMEDFVAWCWLANAGTRTTNSESGDNPAGGYQANTTAGFSIVDYTGTGAVGTMAHGLGAVPDLIIIKNRDEADSWAVYHSSNTSAPATDYLILDTNAATADDATYWNDTAPTSSVFTVTTAHNVNADAEKYIAYCFKSIQGYSKFGSYTGNGDADGPFIYTGFKPAWTMIKRSDAADQWNIYDNKRDIDNDVHQRLTANSSDDESTNVDPGVDYLSNGIKIRTDDDNFNNDGGVYIYMAFAEQPFVTSGGVPCTAR